MDKKKLTDFTDSLSDNLTDTLKETFEKFAGSEDIDAMKDSAKEIADAATDFIRKYPVQSVVGAVAVGFILGTLTSKRK